MASPIGAILLVDDDDDLRETLSDLFLSEGVGTCVSAASLDEVQARAPESLAAELAVLDVNLAGGPSGVEVCCWLRDQGFAAPIVFLTGHAANDSQVVAASRIPGTRILSKPTPISELVRLVHRVA